MSHLLKVTDKIHHISSIILSKYRVRLPLILSTTRLSTSSTLQNLFYNIVHRVRLQLKRRLVFGRFPPQEAIEIHLKYQDSVSYRLLLAHSSRMSDDDELCLFSSGGGEVGTIHKDRCGFKNWRSNGMLASTPLTSRLISSYTTSISFQAA
jgi:hypothetical protein